MKRFGIIAVLLAITTILNATNWVSINSNTPVPTKISLVNSNVKSSVVKLQLDGYYMSDVIINNMVTNKIGIQNGTPLLKKGAPDVQKITTSVIIPNMGSTKVSIVSSKFKEYKNIMLTPSKGNLYRDVNPDDVNYEFGEEYSNNSFYPGELASVREPYIMRDYRGQTIVFYPVQYNPVTKILRVYSEIEVEVVTDGIAGINTIDTQKNNKTVSQTFQGIYAKQFINYSTTSSRYTPIAEQGNMLIISYGDFMDAMQPLIDWKIQSGMPVEIVDVATIGGASQIKQYIADYYNNTGVTFVLLVGDAAQVPSSTAGGNDSDNNYVYIVGSDHYPDALIGRFSAQSEGDVNIQVARTIEYEKDPITDPDWYSEAIGIGSDQGPGDDNEYDYEHIRNINDDLLGFTYTYAYELFDGSQGGEDAPGNPSPTDVALAVNSGATIINYTGHGSNTSWGTTGFSNSDVNNLTNVGKWPFIFSVACVNGNFVNNTCFAEAWLRAENNGEPTGAIATIMSTINQSWNPPMCGQDEMDDILTEQYPDNIKRTFAGVALNGCLQMNDEYGTGGDEMTDTWTVFGDPSVMVRTATPQNMTVVTSPILLGTDSYTITCDANGGLAALTNDGEIISTAVVENGQAVFSFTPLTQPGMVDLVITAFNYRPYIGQVEVIAASGPYLVYADHIINDSLGNDNELPEFGEPIFINVGLQNLGIADGVDVDAVISLNDEYMEIIDSTEYYGLIPMNTTVHKANGFEILLANNIPDQHELNFTIVSSDVNDSTWVNEFTIYANAPVLTPLDLIVNDSEFGNDNGQLDPGETATIKIQTTNTGHCVAANVRASLIAYNQYVTVLSGDTILASLSTFGASYPEFDVVVADDAPEGIIAEMRYELESGEYTANRQYYTKIGRVLEDWETGNISKYDWNTDGDLPWVVDNMYPYEGNYDIISGNIGNNQSSEFWIEYEVMAPDSISFYKKVSSETNFDKLKFFIDDVLQDEWSGTTQSWTKEVYPVAQGVRKFSWVYEKDFSGIGGADKAWVDYIELPTMMVTTVYAGPDNQTCEYSNFQCNGTATNYASVQWETSGTGTFDNEQILTPVYTPSEDDITNKNVLLTLSIIDVDGLPASDTMLLEIQYLPMQAQMPEGPEAIDLQTVTQSEYTTLVLQSANNYLWSIFPEDAGVISGDNVTGTVNWNLDYEGEAWVKVAGNNSCGMGEYSDSLLVIVSNPVGITDVNTTIDANIAPNPNNGRFVITVSSTTDNVYNVSLVDVYGKVISKYSNVDFGNGNHSTFNVQNANTGMYFVIIENNHTRVIKKVTIK